MAYYNSKDMTDKNSEEYDVASYLYVFVIKDNKIIKEYECKEGNFLSYDSNKDNMILLNKEILANSKLNFGKWDGYTFVCDYNGNGLDEILLFVNWSEGFVPVIMEYHNNTMKTVLNIRDEDNNYNNLRGFFEATSNGQDKFLEIYDAYEVSKYSSVRWEKYKWYEKEQMYLLYETGFKPVFIDDRKENISQKVELKDELNDEFKKYEVVIDLWYNKIFTGER